METYELTADLFDGLRGLLRSDEFTTAALGAGFDAAALNAQFEALYRRDDGPDGGVSAVILYPDFGPRDGAVALVAV